MKFSKSFTFKLFIILAIVVACFTTFSYAEEAVVTSLEDEDVITSETESSETTTTNTINNIVQNDLYICESSVTINYPVSGNVYVIAEEVTINNVIDGNVFILANKVNLEQNTYIYSDVFVCANEVNINGYLYDLYSVANNLTIGSKAYIIRDLRASASTLNLNGFIKRNANIYAENIVVDESSASIVGNLSYSATSATIPESIVSGTVTYNECKENTSPVFAKNYIQDALTVLVVALIIILIIVFATPKYADKSTTILENKLAVSFGYGALALILVPLACFILFCTVLGIIPAIAILFVYIFIIQISSAIVSVPIGKIICKKMHKEAKGMNVLISMISVLVIWALEQIPVIGIIIALLVAVLGLGILVYAIFHSEVTKKEKNVVAEASIVVDAKDTKKMKKQENKDASKSNDIPKSKQKNDKSENK